MFCVPVFFVFLATFVFDVFAATQEDNLPITSAVVQYYKANYAGFFNANKLTNTKAALRMKLEQESIPETNIGGRITTQVKDLSSADEITQLEEIALPMEKNMLRYKIVTAYAHKAARTTNGLASQVRLDDQTRASMRLKKGRPVISCLTFVTSGQYDSLTAEEKRMMGMMQDMMGLAHTMSQAMPREFSSQLIGGGDNKTGMEQIQKLFANLSVDKQDNHQ